MKKFIQPFITKVCAKLSRYLLLNLNMNYYVSLAYINYSSRDNSLRFSKSLSCRPELSRGKIPELLQIIIFSILIYISPVRDLKTGIIFFKNSCM